MQTSSQNRNAPIPPEGDHKRGIRIAKGLGILLTGVLLYLLSGGLPPRAWTTLLSLWQTASPPFSQTLLLGAQGALILGAWIVLLVLAVRVARPPRIVMEYEEEGAPGTFGVPQESPWATVSPLSQTQTGQGHNLPQGKSATSAALVQHQDWTQGSAPITPTSQFSSAVNASPIPRREAHGEYNPALPISSYAQNTAPPTSWWTQSPLSEPEPVSVPHAEEPPEDALRRPSGQFIRKPGTLPAAVQSAERTGAVIATSSAVQSQQEGTRERNRVGIEEAGRLLSPVITPTEQLHPGLLALLTDFSSGDPLRPPTPMVSGANPLIQALIGESREALPTWGGCHPGRKEEEVADLLDAMLLAWGVRGGNQEERLAFHTFLIADGTRRPEDGGGTGRTATEAMGQSLFPPLLDNAPLDREAIKDTLLQGMQRANSALYQQHRAQEEAKITTMVAALVVGATLYVANVGENRAYLYRHPDGLVRVTYDHSTLAPLFDENKLTADDLYAQSRESQVYRSLGLQEKVESDVFAVHLLPGDVILLCSDGLWKLVPQTTIQQCIERFFTSPTLSLSQLWTRLVQEAMERGGYDHLSLVVAHVPQPETG